MGMPRGGCVFVSHTSELAGHPVGRSYVQAALDGVARAGLVAVDMRYFTAREGQPAAYCRQRVRGCDVYVGVVGLRYGSTVPDAKVSYMELEFDEATVCGLPRLVFLLDEHTAGLPPALVDPNREAVDGFRRRLKHAGVITSNFSTTDGLDRDVYQSLVELGAGPDRACLGGAAAVMGGGVPLAVVRQDPRPVLASVDVTRFAGRAWVLDQIDAFVRDHACGYVWVEAAAGLGKPDPRM